MGPALHENPDQEYLQRFQIFKAYSLGYKFTLPFVFFDTCKVHICTISISWLLAYTYLTQFDKISCFFSKFVFIWGWNVGQKLEFSGQNPCE